MKTDERQMNWEHAHCRAYALPTSDGSRLYHPKSVRCAARKGAIECIHHWTVYRQMKSIPWPRKRQTHDENQRRSLEEYEATATAIQVKFHNLCAFELVADESIEAQVTKLTHDFEKIKYLCKLKVFISRWPRIDSLRSLFLSVVSLLRILIS